MKRHNKITEVINVQPTPTTLRRSNISLSNVQDTNGEIPTYTITPTQLVVTPAVNKKGKRAFRRELRKRAVQNILGKLRLQVDYPAWYLVGAIMYLCNNFFVSEKMSVMNSNILDKNRWCTIVRKFSHSCLLWTQEPGFGPSLDNVNDAFDRLTKTPLIDLEKAFEDVQQWSSDPLIKKIFMFTMPEEFPGTPGDLFKGVILDRKVQGKTWIQHEDCYTLQAGLKVCWTQKCDIDDILIQFRNFTPSISTFKTVAQFWTWWHEPAQVIIFETLTWNGPVHNCLLKLGKINLVHNNHYFINFN